MKSYTNIFFFACAVMSLSSWATPFSPPRVELPNNVISSPFEVIRPSGPHKGIDISENRPNPTNFERFSSGVWGVVVPPLGGQWGTITVDPFHTPGHQVQHIHTSNQNIRPGDIIAPWTIIGTTGKAAPPDKPVTGVHLHLQVFDKNGSPKYPQWDRAFVDPQKFDTGNPIDSRGKYWIASRVS
ncbi:MAG: M23 family metallopeptidase [Bdellovibrionales bacterium]|nr:M23 family metallopeptidase [Bdellovibrionales bacterium]